MIARLSTGNDKHSRKEAETAPIDKEHNLAALWSYRRKTRCCTSTATVAPPRRTKSKQNNTPKYSHHNTKQSKILSNYILDNPIPPNIIAPMKKITKEILLSTGACFNQVRDFVRAYPEGCEVCWMCFKEAQSKHNLPVGWLTRLVYPGMDGIPRRYKFMDQYRRLRPTGYRITAAGLQFLERRLLRCKPPKLDNRRITDFNEWASSYRFG